MKISEKESRDTGLALILIFLLGIYFFNLNLFLLPAIFIMVIVMTKPIILKPLGYLWFGFSHYLGLFVSKLILTLLYFMLITPFGIIMKLFRKDPLNRTKFKMTKESLFVNREHMYIEEDLLHLS